MVFICHGHRFNDMIRAMEANPAVTRPVIHKYFKFADAIKGESQAHTGKVVIRVLRLSWALHGHAETTMEVNSTKLHATLYDTRL
jgi:hypothetical protein